MPEITVSVKNDHATLALARFRTVFVVIDHAALATAGRSRVDGQDFRMRWTGTGGDPAKDLTVHVESPNTTTCRVYFSLRQSIAVGVTDARYRLSFGNLDSRSKSDVPRRDLSQYAHGTDGAAADEARIQPFLFFDDFQWDFVGSAPNRYFTPATPGNPPDAGFYTVSGDWHVRAGGGLESPYQSSRYMHPIPARVSSLLVNSSVRVRALIDLGHAGVPIAGVLMNRQAVGLTGYGIGAGPGFTTTALGHYVAAAATVVSTGSVGDMTDRPVFVDGIVYDNGVTHEVIGSVDGVGITPWSDGAQLYYGQPGLFNDMAVPVAGDIVVHRWWYELFDGVVDFYVTVTAGAIPAPTIPDPDRVRHIPARLSDVAFSPEVKSSRGRSASAYRLDQWELSWDPMTPSEFYELMALILAYGSITPFTWTPPGGSAITVAVVPASWRWRKSSAADYSAGVTLERIAS